MKKALAFLFVTFLSLSSCEDGEIDVQSFDFGDAQVQTCGDMEDGDFFMYKVSGNEVMIVIVPQTNFIKDDLSTPVEAINGTSYQVIYRLYDGPVTASFMCSDIPQSSPKVVEEWVATGGTIQVANAPNFEEIDEIGARLPDGYNHTITFQDITFDTGHGIVTYDDEEGISFGTFKTETTDLDLADFRCDEEETCVITPCGTRFFKLEGLKVLSFQLSQETYDYLFSNVEGTKTRLLDDDDQARYRVFNVGPSTDALCSETFPTGVAALETWISENGVEGVSGILQVETDNVGSTYTHKIRLRSVRFKKGSDWFSFGNDYLIGQIVTGT